MSNQVRKRSFDIKLFSLVILMFCQLQGISISQDVPTEGAPTELTSEDEMKFLIPHPDDAKRCAEDFKNCQDLSYYPTDIARKLILEGKADRTLLGKNGGIITNSSEEVNARFEGYDYGLDQFCPIVRHVFYPKAVIDRFGNATFIIQAPDLDFNQGMITEVCDTKQDMSCGVLRKHVPQQYELKCFQRMIHKNFITFNTTTKTANVPFQVPSCCLCGYQ